MLRSPELRHLDGWRCLGTLSFDLGIWAGHTCTPPHCHHAGLPACEFCTIWQAFSKYNVVSTSETSSDLCHCLKHSLAPRPSHPRLQNEVHGLFLEASLASWKALSQPVPSRVSPRCSVSSICWRAGMGPLWARPTALNAQTLRCVDHFPLSQCPSWQTSSS